MTKRIKADPLIIGDLARAESAMMEMAALEREMRAVTDEANAKIDGLKDAAKNALSTLEASKKELAKALAVYLKMNRKELLSNRKSLELAFGVMGFRTSTKVNQMNNITAEMSIELCKEKGLEEGVRYTPALDKEAMRAWPEARLNIVGLTRKTQDAFFIELKEEQLATV